MKRDRGCIPPKTSFLLFLWLHPDYHAAKSAAASEAHVLRMLVAKEAVNGRRHARD